MQTFLEDLPPAHEKMVGTHFPVVVTSPLSDEAEAGNAEEQPARNNLTDWNGQGDSVVESLNEQTFRENMP